MKGSGQSYITCRRKGAPGIHLELPSYRSHPIKRCMIRTQRSRLPSLAPRLRDHREGRRRWHGPFELPTVRTLELRAAGAFLCRRRGRFPVLVPGRRLDRRGRRRSRRCPSLRRCRKTRTLRSHPRIRSRCAVRARGLEETGPAKRFQMTRKAIQGWLGIGRTLPGLSALRRGA